jgi:hypothetical protein
MSPRTANANRNAADSAMAHPMMSSVADRGIWQLNPGAQMT